MRVFTFFGPFWVQRIRYVGPRVKVLCEKGHTQETEFPWRSGVCWVFRLPFTNHAFALGKWVESHVDENEEEPTLSFRPLPRWFQSDVEEK